MTKSVVQRSKYELLAERQSIQIGTGNTSDWREKKNALKQAVIKGESPLKLWEVNPSNLRL